MIAGVCLGTNDIEKASKFYDAVLATLGMVRQHTSEHELAYGTSERNCCFWVITPFNEKPATNGNGTQVSFKANDNETVAAFHAAAMAQGGSDEGAPGPRAYTPTYYGAYCRDPEGNKLHAFNE